MRQTCRFFETHSMNNNTNSYETKKPNLKSSINFRSPTLPDELLFSTPTESLNNFYNDSEKTYEFWKDSTNDIDGFKQFIYHDDSESNELIPRKSYGSSDWQSTVSKLFPKSKEWKETKKCHLDDAYGLSSLTLSDSEKVQTTSFLNSSTTPSYTLPRPSFHTVCQPECAQSLGSHFLINNNDYAKSFSYNASDNDKNIFVESTNQIEYFSENNEANYKKNSATCSNELCDLFQQESLFSSIMEYPSPHHFNCEAQKKKYVKVSLPMADENASKHHLIHRSHVENQSNVLKTSSCDISYNINYSNTLQTEVTESIQNTNLNLTKNVTEPKEVATNGFLKAGKPDVKFFNDNTNEISSFSSKNTTNTFYDNVQLKNKDLFMESHKSYLNTRRKTLNPSCTETSRPANSYMNLLENLDRFFPLSSGSRLPPPLPSQTLDICYTSDKPNTKSLQEPHIPTTFVRRSRAKTSPAISNPFTDKLFTTSEPHDHSLNVPFFQPIETMSSRFLTEKENLHLEGPLSHAFPIPKFHFFCKSVDATATNTTNNNNNICEYNDSMLNNKSDGFNYPFFNSNTKNSIALSMCKKLIPRTTDLQTSPCVSFDKSDVMHHDADKNTLPYSQIQEDMIHEFDPSKDCYAWNNPKIMTGKYWNTSLNDKSNPIQKITGFNQPTKKLASHKKPTLCKASLMYFPFCFQKNIHNPYNKVESQQHPPSLHSGFVTNSLTTQPWTSGVTKSVTTNSPSQPITEIPLNDVPQSDDSHALQNFLHIQRQCRPCAFFYSKKKNCRNSYSCKFCHHSDHSIISMKQWKKNMVKKNVSMSVVHCST
ncbi:uncharacterized protein LOC128884073 isoform X2 [Hylaeus volcanicus]|uniref:uncharacterized protein LOC128884073 isoform X2 n=1 Tax=Hylaeus volcanicus TaxID=313075 RepID=UPI0023B7EA0C|nr:uncharacterized protein LOC128884073 isoform X2 [Hylaeus volcanicus]